jgi:hypothetical protein
MIVIVAPRRRKGRDPEKLRANQNRYYARHAARLRADARANDDPEKHRARNARFAAKNPTYWREYFPRRRLKLAWLKWARVCAVSRRRLAEFEARG